MYGAVQARHLNKQQYSKELTGNRNAPFSNRKRKKKKRSHTTRCLFEIKPTIVCSVGEDY